MALITIGIDCCSATATVTGAAGGGVLAACCVCLLDPQPELTSNADVTTTGIKKHKNHFRFALALLRTSEPSLETKLEKDKPVPE
ncbi:MAG TPA: hypothetical protein VG897_09225 [Terriglobales bacterium]|nr:hypothetical protein [Terriglobales bacterium]